jgi:ribonuclease E
VSAARATKPEPGNEADPAERHAADVDPNRRDAGEGDGSRAGKRRRRRRRSRGGQKEKAQQNANAGDGAAASEEARVLAESLRAAVLRHTSAAVLGRGTGYAKRNRVAELRISGGRARARVRGSGTQRYRVEITVPQKPAPPVVTKVRWTCDCPYAAEHRRGTCKHVVALALVAAKRIEKNEAMYQRWMGQPAANAAEASPAEFDALAERLLAAFTAQPASVDHVLDHAMAVAPPPFEVPVR